MQLKDVLAGSAVLRSAAKDENITSVTADSRKCGPGSLFFAVRGSNCDAHAYVDAALRAGAVCAIENAAFFREGCVLVDDSRRALALASANINGGPAQRLRMVGITGTNGKTTTAAMLRQILVSAGRRTGLLGTVANDTGANTNAAELTTAPPPLLHAMLAQMVKSNCEFAVMEVSSHALEQKRVCGIEYETAVFTNLGRDHLDYHGTLENYFAAKQQLFRQCRHGVINADDPHARELLAMGGFEPLTFSASGADADLTARDVTLTDRGARFCAVWHAQRRPVCLPLPGKFTPANALAAIGAALSLGVEFDVACAALYDMPPVSGRMEKVCNTPVRVFIDFAHTPDAMSAMLESVRKFTSGRVIVVYGCGGDRDRGKRPEMAEITSRLADLSVMTVCNPRGENPACIIAEMLEGFAVDGHNFVAISSRREAIDYALNTARAGDTVVLAGKGHEKYIDARGKKEFFSERQVVVDHYSAAGIALQ